MPRSAPLPTTSAPKHGCLVAMALEVERVLLKSAPQRQAHQNFLGQETEPQLPLKAKP